MDQGVVIAAGCSEPMMVIGSSVDAGSWSQPGSFTLRIRASSSLITIPRAITMPRQLPTMHARWSGSYLPRAQGTLAITAGTEAKSQSTWDSETIFPTIEPPADFPRARAAFPPFSTSTATQNPNALFPSPTTAIAASTPSTTTPATTAAVGPSYLVETGASSNRTGAGNSSHGFRHYSGIPVANWNCTTICKTNLASAAASYGFEVNSTATPLRNVVTTPTYWFSIASFLTSTLAPTTSTTSLPSTLLSTSTSTHLFTFTSTSTTTLAPSTIDKNPQPDLTAPTGRSPAMLSVEIILGCFGFVLVLGVVKWGCGRMGGRGEDADEHGG